MDGATATYLLHAQNDDVTFYYTSAIDEDVSIDIDGKYDTRHTSVSWPEW